MYFHNIKKYLLNPVLNYMKYPFLAAGKIVGICGSIGSGKSILSDYLREFNYHVIDFDSIAKEIIARKETQKALLAHFGTKDMNLVKLLAKKSQEKSFQLSQIVGFQSLHEVFTRTDKLFEQGERIVFWESSMLIETGSFKTFSQNILVTAPLEETIKRIALRDNKTEEEVSALLKIQMSDDERKKLLKEHPSVLELDNSKTLEEFKEKLHDVINFLKV